VSYLLWTTTAKLLEKEMFLCEILGWKPQTSIVFNVQLLPYCTWLPLIYTNPTSIDLVKLNLVAKLNLTITWFSLYIWEGYNVKFYVCLLKQNFLVKRVLCLICTCLRASWTTIMVHSRRSRHVPQSKITQKPAWIFPDYDGVVLARQN